MSRGIDAGHASSSRHPPRVSFQQNDALEDFDSNTTDGSRHSSANSGSSYLRQGAFAGHRDTFARLPGLPQAHHHSAPQQRKAIQRLPREILQIMYHFLDPVEFDTARHTCREWLLASLDFNLLTIMLRRFQCQGA